MKYIFLTTKKAFIESSFELQKCGISMRETLLFEIKPVPEEWAIEHLTKKAYSDVYLNKSTFDDDLTSDSLSRLYNLIQVFRYIQRNDLGNCIIVENIHDFCRIYSNIMRNTIYTYITNHKGTDLLFLDNSYQINYSHYKYSGESFKQNEYVCKKVPAFYINPDFVKKFLEMQRIFYKPFEYTLNDSINETKVITFFTNKDIADSNIPDAYRNTIVVNSGKILLSLLGLGYALFFYNKYRK
jgi:hypothetical protein